MHPANWRLINGEFLEAIPSPLARARGNATARLLSQSDWLLRKKSDGRFVAARRAGVLVPLQRSSLDRRLMADLRQLEEADAAGERLRPLSGLLDGLQALGLEHSYGEAHQLALVAEPTVLRYAGMDRYARPLWLTTGASCAWRDMRRAARADGIALEAISGYRSHLYQMGIFRRKLARGIPIEEILTVNAAPGYSEHHGGNAMDIGAPGEPPAEESFEATPAFGWLHANAARFGFSLSYPRGNPHGIVYEPWHWRWQPGRD